MNPRSRSTTTRRACWRMSSTARSTCIGCMAGWCPNWPRAITCGGCCRWCAPRSREAQTTPAQLDGVAYTAGPGLIGALLTGAALGRSLAYAWNIPAVAVHHLEGHLLAPLLEAVPPPFPHLALLVSGGHTMLIDVSAVGVYAVLGETRDDAAGEAFDKSAKLLGLPYPGGPELAAAGAEGGPGRFEFPRPMLDRAGLEFSFSGLKTAVSLAVKNRSPGRADSRRHRRRRAGRHRRYAGGQDPACTRAHWLPVHRGRGWRGREPGAACAARRGGRAPGSESLLPAHRVLHRQCRHDRGRGNGATQGRQAREPGNPRAGDLVYRGTGVHGGAGAARRPATG